MPAFKSTFTWSVPGRIVTLMILTPAAFNAAKTSPAYKVVPISGVGDDAFYAIVGDTMVSLATKK